MTEWQPSETLPSKADGERFQVYLAFDDGVVKHAAWSAYTEYASEYHATTGVCLGQYPQGGDAFYMTEDGFDVRQDDEGGFWFYFTYPDGLDKPQLGPRVTAWMEALKPKPRHPSASANTTRI